MQKVNLNLIPGGVLPVINVSQYDEGKQFQFAVFDGAASYDLTGKTVMVDVQKTDGHGCEYGATDLVNNVPVVAVSGNVVTITTPQQMTACAGDCVGELKIIDSTSTIGTLNFILMCEPAPLNDGTIISDTELPAIIDAARSSAARAEDAAQDAEAAAAHYPYIGDDGYWYEWDVATEQFVKTDVSAAGRAPDITMTATADATSSSTPTVTVTKTGTDEEPNFALAFSGLKGPKGDTGPIGPTGDSQDVLEAVGWTGANLFEGREGTFGWSGITFTQQNDGRYLATGTRTDTGTQIYSFGTFLCKAGVEYKLSGCPTGGSAGSDGFILGAYPMDTTQPPYVSDLGSGVTIPAFNSDTSIKLAARIPQGFVCPSNFLWSPMISRNGGAYVPYHPTVQEELWDGEVCKSKNLLPLRTHSLAGYPYVVDQDGYVSYPTDYGDARAWTYNNCNFKITLPAGKYRLVGYTKKAASSGYLGIAVINSSGTELVSKKNNDQFSSFISSTAVFTLSANTDIGVEFKIGNGSYRFMLCPDEQWLKSRAYQKYYEPLKTSVVTTGGELQRALGAKNRLKITRDYIRSSAINPFGTWAGDFYSWRGVTFTCFFDDYGNLAKCVVDGTATDVAAIYFIGSGTTGVYATNVYEGMVLNGCPKGGSTSTYSIRLQAENSPYILADDTGDGLPIGQQTSIKAYIRIAKGATVSNLEFYPMLRLASDPDDTYAPYAETNFELTQNKFNTSNIAPTEDGAGASKAYSTGQYLIHNGELRKATTAIASDAEITDNNTDVTTLAEILELNKNELVSGIATLSTDRTVFDISDATLDCAVNRFTRRISIRFSGVTLIQQLSVAGALAIMTITNGYWGLITSLGIATVRKDNTYYRAQLYKNTSNTALAIVAQETIPAGAVIGGYIEWPY